MDSDSCIDSYIVCVLVAGQSFFLVVFYPEQFTGLFIPGMELGLLMPKFFVSIKQIFGWPLPGAHNPKGRSVKLVYVC